VSTQRIPLSGNSQGASYAALAKGATAVQVAAAPVTPSINQQQVVTSNTVTFTAKIPAIAAGAFADVPYNVMLGLPSFSLAQGCSGQVVVVLDLAEQPVGALVVFSKQFAYGGVGPSNTWTLPASGRFQAGRAVGTLRVFSPAGCAEQTLTGVCSSFVFGVPAE
jgi:hypothetical protein